MSRLIARIVLATASVLVSAAGTNACTMIARLGRKVEVLDHIELDHIDWIFAARPPASILHYMVLHGR
jgi:hypothetical protein